MRRRKAGMRTKSLLGCLLLALALSQGAARAEEETVPPGTTVLALSETASRKVREDLLAALLEVRATAGDAATAQAGVNEAMAAARRLAERATGVEIETGRYSVYVERPEPERADAAERWVAAQALLLQSPDGDVLLRLVGELQDRGLAVQQLDWRVADATRQRVERELTGEALAALRERAEMAAAAMGMKLVGWKRLSLEGGRGPIVPFAERAVTMAAAPPPVAIAGEAEVEISVSGEALLQ
jgi:predicted secreted protein